MSGEERLSSRIRFLLYSCYDPGLTSFLKYRKIRPAGSGTTGY